MIQFIKTIIDELEWDLAWMPVAHFALSAVVGLLVYWLTVTILSRGRFGTYLREKQSTRTGFSIRRFSLAVALCFAVAVHILEDYTLDIF